MCIRDRCQVDLVGRQDRLLRLLDHVHRAHQQVAAVGRQAGHLGQVGVPDDAREAGVVRVVDLDQAQVRPAPQQRAAVGLAPVSYTHLDVYKRQVQKHKAFHT